MPSKNYVTQKPPQVREVASAISKAAEDLQAIAKMMEDDTFDELDIPNFKNLQRAIGFCTSYVRGAKDAYFAAKKRRGDFGVFPPPKAKKKAALSPLKQTAVKRELDRASKLK